MQNDFITKKAKRLISYLINDGISSYKEVTEAIEEDLREIDEDDEKIKYLNIILEKVNHDYADHLKVCGEPETCHKNHNYDHIVYFITKELKHLGIRFNDDTFTSQEKETAESKLDKILSELESLKASQEFIYTEIMPQFEELKEMYFLGKKKWYQLLVGKSVEMVAAGVVSETISKQVIGIINENVLPMLK